MEADDQWQYNVEVSTENAAYLSRFQELCEEYRLRPTYLVEWAMACCEKFQEFGRSVVERGVAEIGMHLHPWTTPPLVSLTGADHMCHPFLIEFPEDVMREKVERITDLLVEVFQVPVISHRAGRWMLDERYAQILIDQGYLVDCSVTPHISWKNSRGAPDGCGPRDYSDFPEEAYFLDPGCISKKGDSALLEVPMTVVARRRRDFLPEGSLVRRAANWISPEVVWMRPATSSRRRMCALASQALAEGRDYVEFMLHSSELMPGGSPYFRSKRSIEALYADLEALFAFVDKEFDGVTLAEYHARFVGDPTRPATGRPRFDR
ncbi:deacetylase [Nonomuraea sp. 3N208]|uniref:deacetylase n=1 Tax=Nonomuraea sp. 3N208 TaxID=3457421 RepID=UPI003FD18DD8